MNQGLTRRLAVCTTLAAIGLALASGGGSAQGFPERPIKLLVGFAPGGPADALARITAQILTEGLGQPVIVENRAGAGGTIAATAVAKAAPDGYTLLVCANSDVINPLANKQVQYSIEASFTPIALIARAPNVLVVHPSIPVGSVQELVEYARAHPDALTYGSAGVGTISHLAGAFVASAAHLQVVHVPYKGTAAAQIDLLSGRLQFMFDSMVSANGQCQGRQGQGAGGDLTSALAHGARAADHGRERVRRLRHDGLVRFARAGWHPCAGRYPDLRGRPRGLAQQRRAPAHRRDRR